MKTRLALVVLVAVVAMGFARKTVVEPPKPVSAPVKVVDKDNGVKLTSGPFKGETVAPKPVTKEEKKEEVTPTKVDGKGMQVTRWNKATLNKKDLLRLDKMVATFQRTQDLYLKLEKLRSNGVPAPIIFGFHMRESDLSMKAHLHEGSSLMGRTKYVPKGRLPNSPPPYQFVVSAEDALYDYEGLHRRDWKHLESALQAAESYNGLGYQKKGRISPYLWAGTNVYTGGKYVADGVFSSTAYDQQLGVVAVMKRLEERGVYQFHFE